MVSSLSKGNIPRILMIQSDEIPAKGVGFIRDIKRGEILKRFRKTSATKKIKIVGQKHESFKDFTRCHNNFF